jgi:hypothetical protein
VKTRLFGGLMALSLVVTPPQATPELPDGAKPRIEELTATLKDQRATVSFKVLHGLSREAEERLHSGIPVTLKHKVEVLAKRGFPLMPSKVLARTVVETRAEYDSLTRRYDLIRTVEHRLRPKRFGPLKEEQRRITDSADEMLAWMTELVEIPVFNPAKPLQGDRLRVRVESSLGRRYLMFVFPTTHSVSGELDLEAEEP